MPRRYLLFLAPVVLLATALTATSLAAPTARFTVTPDDPRTGEAVRFDASASGCDAAPCTYTWSDDGPDGAGGTSWTLGSGAQLSFTFRRPGTKHVRLTVRNADGETTGAVRSLAVVAGPRPDAPDPAPSPDPAPAPSPDPAPAPDPDPAPGPGPAPAGCDRSATPATFSSQLSASGGGDVVCLQSGDYGTWSGTGKAITVRAASGQTPRMRIDFSSGDAGFTLDGVTSAGGSITNGARDITIRNSTFTGHLRFDGLANSDILLDHNTHNDIDSPNGAPNARLGFYWSSSTPSGVTIANSLMAGGDSDGVHTGVGVNVIGNEFRDILADGPNHTDNIQFEGGSAGSVIRGNWVHQTVGGETQGITAYDRLAGVTIEDNVVDIRRAWGIEVYSDQGSTIRHNTLPYRAPGCYGGSPCGQIDINRKSQDPAGSGTVVTDNVATGISVSNGSTVARRTGNLLRQGAAPGDILGVPVFAGGPAPSSYAGFRLAAGSPGLLAASDGLAAGIR
jgi:hypothetical protein